jgi:hypothetical protein
VAAAREHDRGATVRTLHPKESPRVFDETASSARGRCDRAKSSFMITHIQNPQVTSTRSSYAAPEDVEQSPGAILILIGSVFATGGRLFIDKTASRF